MITIYDLWPMPSIRLLECFRIFEHLLESVLFWGWAISVYPALHWWSYLCWLLPLLLWAIVYLYTILVKARCSSHPSSSSYSSCPHNLSSIHSPWQCSPSFNYSLYSIMHSSHLYSPCWSLISHSSHFSSRPSSSNLLSLSSSHSFWQYSPTQVYVLSHHQSLCLYCW